MRKILLILSAMLIFVTPVYAADAVIPDDDSAQYLPFPPQPVQEEKPAPKPAPKKTPAKKQPVQRKAPAPKPAPKKTVRRPAQVRQSSLQKGIELMNQDRYEQAKPYLLKAIQEDRNNPNVWYWYGVYHEKTGGYYQAQYFYSKAVTIDPAFEPLSRVVFYPDDPEKTPLWDPKRPARVYPIETSSRGITQVPPNVSRFPNAPNDPEMPQVPVYTPPEPGSSPLDGDSWNPAVYVPPRPEELQTEGEESPLYVPPDAQGIIADESQIYRETTSVPMYRPENDQIITDRDRILRADKPLYNPPQPGQKIAQRPSPQPEQPKKSVQPQKKQSNTPQKSATVPASRVVRQPQRKAAPAAKTQPRQTKQTQTRRNAQGSTASQDVKPQTQTRQRQTQPQQQQQQVQPQPPAQPEIERQPVQPQRRQSDYLPPVGQYAPDPGTISDTPIPPVGQGSQN